MEKQWKVDCLEAAIKTEKGGPQKRTQTPKGNSSEKLWQSKLETMPEKNTSANRIKRKSAQERISSIVKILCILLVLALLLHLRVIYSIGNHLTGASDGTFPTNYHRQIPPTPT